MSNVTSITTSNPRRLFALALLAVAVIQTAALLYIVIGRDQLLKTGREVVMQVIPVDPRDIFRGDYVVLGTPLSLLTFGDGKLGDLPQGLERGDIVYVVAAPGPDGVWQARRASVSYPADAASDETVFKGRVAYLDKGLPAASADGTQPPRPPTANVRYGIESFFVPEGEGKAIEDEVRAKTVKAVLAVGPDGTTAIKALMVGDKRIETPAIF